MIKLNHYFRTWIEISTRNVRNNYRIFRKLLAPKVKMLGVVKSNAYGHELMGLAKKLQALGIDWLGVDSITEALTLRDHKITKPILVMGYTLPAHFALAGGKNIALTISTFENLQILAKLKKRVAVHIKIDTGMHRQGFFLNDLPKVLDLLKKHPRINFQGLYTHFASAKKPDSLKDTERQILEFKKATSLARAAGFKPICHAAATAGILNFHEAHFDMVRPGIGLFGLWPSPETKAALQKKYRLAPALTWKSLIAEVKWVEKGEKLGYDYTEKLEKKTLVAIIPIGYWHGYWRAFSNKAFVLADGKRCKILGRVAMDMVTIDISNVRDAKVGDEVVILGNQGKENISADELAKIANTTNYEIVTRLNPLIKKVFI